MRRVFSYGGLVFISVEDGPSAHLRLFERELLRVQDTPQPHIRVLVDDTGRLHRPVKVVGLAGALSHAGEFLCSDGRGHHCAVDFDDVRVAADTRIDLKLCCTEFSANVLLEWLVIPLAMFPLAALGFAPLHASGFAIPTKGAALVLSAWSGVGKTNLLLSALRTLPGVVYLGDDQVLVSRDGSAVSSSRTIAAYGYNLEYLPPISKRQRSRLLLGRSIRNIFARYQRRLGRFASAFIYAANALGNLKLPVRRSRTVTEVSHQPISIHAICYASPTASTLTFRTHDTSNPDELAGMNIAVMEIEYAEFLRYVRAWQWVVGRGQDPWEALRSEWRKNLTGYFEAIPRVVKVDVPFPGQGGLSALEWNDLLS